MDQRRITSLFECVHCKRRFLRESQLDLHIELVGQKVKTHCSKCRSLSSDPTGLHRHALTHGKIKPYECHLCKRKFVSLVNLKSHINLHRLGRIPIFRLDTTLGARVGKKVSSDEEDDSVVTPGDDGDDEYDEYVMSDDHSLNKHLKFKIDWKIYSSDPLFKSAQVALSVLKILICQSCGKAVMSLYDNGLTLDEGLTVPTKCLGCQGDLIPWDGDLSRITSSIHLLESPPLECISCNQVFPSMAKLKKHMQVHAEARSQAGESNGESSVSFDSWSTRLSCNSGFPGPSSSHSQKLDRHDTSPDPQAASSESGQSLDDSLDLAPAFSPESSPSIRDSNETTLKRVPRVELCRISSTYPEFQCRSGRAASSGKSSTERTRFARTWGRKRLRVNKGQSEDNLQQSSSEEAALFHSIPSSNGPSKHSMEMSLSAEEFNSVCTSGDRDSVPTSGVRGSKRKLFTGPRKMLPRSGSLDQISDRQSCAADTNSTSPESDSAAKMMQKRPGGARRRKTRFQVARLGITSADTDLGHPYDTPCSSFSTSSGSACGQHSDGASSKLRVSLQKMYISPEKMEPSVPHQPIQKSKNQNPFSMNGISDVLSQRCGAATGMLRTAQKLHIGTGPHSTDSGKKRQRKPSKNPCSSASNGFKDSVTKQNSNSPVPYRETFKRRFTSNQDLVETALRKCTQTSPSPSPSSSGKPAPVRRSLRAPRGLPWTWYDDREYAHTCRICGKTFLLLERLLVHTAMHQRA